MEEDKFIRVQHQAKENSEELKDFLRDLKNWETDAKKRDRELNVQKLSDENKLPPIRNQVSKCRKKKKKAVTENNNGSVAKNKRISSFDYSSWDKFDVDEALKQIDDDKNSSTSEDADNSDDNSDDELETEQRKQKALLEKDKGNEYFKQGKYDEAISCYSIGIENDPTNAILPANRAMALLKKNQLAAAEVDCDLALSIDSTYVKAYLRRGCARFGLKKFELAKEDFEKVLELDPDNKQAKNELLRIEKEIKKNNQKDQEMMKTNEKEVIQAIWPSGDNEKSNTETSQEDKSIVKPIYKPPHLRSKKPLKKIEIEEVLSDSDESVEENSTTSPNSLTNNSTTKNSNTSIPETTKYIRKELPSIPSKPQTAYQFYAHWQTLRNYPDLQYKYLKKLSPELIPKLFHQSMEMDIFSNVIMILNDHLNENEDSFLYLKNLTQVGRFKTLAMFLSSSEKKGI
ncbi:RNA polymerase II-associated protein 3-like [Centruroides sculpturatus]|uniref:RNA polymerase II-associated protein 3-like n=1 Tax=Centruroides sculpturatus TaxID=218467 RepID=UPI000C6DB140|nr:RNA polymerase II-associated protein 3-like [Centruroides sculpturatus]